MVVEDLGPQTIGHEDVCIVIQISVAHRYSITV